LQEEISKEDKTGWQEESRQKGGTRERSIRRRKYGRDTKKRFKKRADRSSN